MRFKKKLVKWKGVSHRMPRIIYDAEQKIINLVERTYSSQTIIMVEPVRMRKRIAENVKHKKKFKSKWISEP